MVAFLHHRMPGIVKQLGAAINQVAKAGNDREALEAARAARVEEILADLDFSDWTSVVDDVQSVLELIAKDGAKEGIAQVTTYFDADQLTLANNDAIAYAVERAAEMVGMKVVDGELVENPDAEWAITEGTRDMLREDVSQALDEGWSNDTLAAEIADNYAFSDERAETIARTETARADVAGNIAGWQASGEVEQKQWSAASDCCDECQDIDGETVGLDEDFSTGDDGPPAHPNCRCALLPVLTEEAAPAETNQDDQ